MLTTEQLRARAESLGLDFFIERRAGVWVKEWLNNGCTSATAEEVMMWSILANREAQPVGYTSKRNLANVTGRHLELFSKDSAVYSDPVALYTAPPAPAVPEEAKVGEMPFLGNSEPGYVRGWNACRAAMLAQPVSSGYKLPGGWIACSERMPEVGERDWRTALPVLVKCEIGVIPAYYGFTYHEGEQCFGFMESIKFGDGSGSGPEQHENRLMMHVTHWMPLPAAPEGGNNSSST
ncbi:DUF551 domain-containing protein [Serratia ureilytica]|uniref:DUF551 domain-containing protein n=1 Tax=Serratia ureilytica TaxID=300181 RepID=UPI0018D879D9|nr:DUF551 domain-containing protein [Serratia ureilytica]MBH3006801.1 DUF551 domain-containing protein [Serratia ureilytica]